jgi:ATP-dependent protease ClpP protease subunit
MTPAEYAKFLADAGFSAEQAELIARWRAGKPQRAGSFRLEATTVGGEKSVDLLLYDFIGFDPWSGGGHTPKALIEQLEAAKPFDRITMRINSPGGDVFDAVTMLNILRRQQAKISVEVEGLAASAASFLAQAADPGELRVSEAGMFMVHRAFAVVMGNTKDMLDMAGVLEKMDGQIADIYAGRSGRRQATWLDYMDAETWFIGREAVEAKLADKVIPAQRAAACFDRRLLNVFRHAPKDLAARLFGDQAEEPDDDASGACFEVGDRVVLADAPQTAGIIRQVVSGPAYSLELDDAPGKVEQWYVGAELMLEDPLEEEEEEGAQARGGRRPHNAVPANPPNGGGEGVDGVWSKPALKDFTGARWEDLSHLEQMAIAKHFGWYDSLDTFDELKFPHHFAAGDDAGKPSLNGVRNALARLPQAQGLSDAQRAAIEKHLQAHLPAESDEGDGSAQDAEAVAVRLRLLELEEAAQ